MTVFDVLVIGGGPAGLNAPLALCRAVCKAVVFDSGGSLDYRNSISKHMHTVLTWDHKDAREFRAAARKEILDRYDTTTFVDQRVPTVKKLENGLFEATTAEGQQYEGRKLILATGVKDVYPNIKGYSNCWGNAIFHCLFCHGYEERGGPKAGLLALGMTANPQFAMPVSGIAKRLAGHVTIYTHGDQALAGSFSAQAAKYGHTVDDRNIARLEKLEGETGNLMVHFEDGSSEHLSFLAHTPQSKQNTPFAEQLGLELESNGNIKVSQPFGATCIDGVFAVGDCSSPKKSAGLALANGLLTGAGALHSLVMDV